jgi:hypothetical protein
MVNGFRTYSRGNFELRISNFELVTRSLRRHVSLFFTLLLFAVLPFRLLAQDVTVTARVDSNNIRIGDWLKLHLEIQHPANAVLQSPTIADSLRGLEVLRIDSLPRKISGQNIIESANFTLTAFDSGTFVVPPIVVKYKTADDSTLRSAESGPIPVFVHGIDIDTTKEIKDIKPPISLSLSFAEILPWLLGVVGLGVIGWLVYYIMKKRKKGESIIPEAPPRPAHEIALESLRSLEAEKLWQRGKVKEYHSQVTDIVRMYIERRFHVAAMEMITDEIMSSQIIQRLEKSVSGSLREMLTLADLVKFAKLQPLAEENDKSLLQAKTFIELTWKPDIEVAQEPATEEASA